MQEAAQFLGRQPEDIVHRMRIGSALLLAQQAQAEQRQHRNEEREARHRRAEIGKPERLREVPTLMGRK